MCQAFLFINSNEINRYIEDNKRSRYLPPNFVDVNKGEIKKYKEVWKKLSISKDNLPLKQKWLMQGILIIIRSVFCDTKHYPQIILDKCLYELAELVLS